MTSGIQLFIILAVTGGLIAWAGDHIGRKVGRKHWRIFSLRPKHTGTIVTTVFGIVMIGAVMGVLYACDGDFRAAVHNEANVWRQKFDVAASQVEREKLSLARQNGELKQLSAHNQTLRVEEERIQARLQQAQQLLNARQTQIQATQRRLEERQARLAALARQEQALKGRVAALNQENSQLRQRGQQLLASQRTLEQEVTTLAWKVHNARTSTLAARSGEILLNAEATGGQTPARSQQIVAKALSLLDKQSPARAAHGKVSIAAGDVQAAVAALQQPGRYLIRVTAANNARPNEPLTVRLTVLPQPSPTVDIASDILERDRLHGPHVRLASPRPAASEAPSASASLSSEDRQSLLEVIQQLSQATTPGNVESRLLSDPSLGGPLNLRLDTPNTPQ